MCSFDRYDFNISVNETQADWWNLFQNCENNVQVDRSCAIANCGSVKQSAWKGESTWSGCCHDPGSRSSGDCSRDAEHSCRVKASDFNATPECARTLGMMHFGENEEVQSTSQIKKLHGSASTGVKSREAKRGSAARETPCGSFIHKRNERERERVRCVNEGYADLRRKLPLEFKHDKKVSKVETLRYAIMYIKHLQAMLDESDSGRDQNIRFTL